MIQYMVPADCPKCQQKDCSHSIADQTRTDIQQIIQQIQTEFGADKLWYKEQDLSVEHRIGLWAATNILLITTLRDGQCLPPLEYIAVKKQMNQ